MVRAPHVAIIDDDASIRAAICNLISAIGYSTDAFPSAEAFLESDHLSQTSCIIADVQMPGMTGVDLLRRLAGDKAGIGVILITAFPQEATRKAALQDGAVGYLAKPLHEQSLVACLERAVAMPS